MAAAGGPPPNLYRWLQTDDEIVNNAVNTVRGMAPYGAPLTGAAPDLSALLERALNTLEPNKRPPWALELADRLRPIDAGVRAPQRFAIHLLGY